MSLRITSVPQDNGTGFRLDGAVAGSEVDTLISCCGEAQPPLTLDLKGVIDVDERGVTFLRSVAADGASLVRPSAYVSMRIRRRADS